MTNPHYQVQRRAALRNLTNDMLDRPVVDIVNRFNARPHCFTLQSCYGHFVRTAQKASRNFEPLPAKGAIGKVEYRIAYIAFCIENSPAGRALLEALKEIPAVDPQNVQFCCAEWFWKRQVNSYVLQVVPNRFRRSDTAMLDSAEALRIEKTRNAFFVRLSALFESAEKI